MAYIWVKEGVVAMGSKQEAMIRDVNEMEESTFRETLGWVFEHSPWVMERVWTKRPFAAWKIFWQRVEEAVLAEAGRGDQLTLLRAHPDLAGKLEMSPASALEQKGAGLDQLEPVEYIRFSAFNQAYMDKFQIPFIMAIRGQSKDSILAAMRLRLAGEPEEEHHRALREVVKIARFRLEDTLENRLMKRLSGETGVPVKAKESGEPSVPTTERSAASGRITTHVLDLSSGKPAAGVHIELWRLAPPPEASGLAGGVRIAEAVTGPDGRLQDPLVSGAELVPGSYRLVFHAGDYFARPGAGSVGNGDSANSHTVFDRIPVEFTLQDADSHYHIPLLIAPGGYSTYRGS